VKRVLVTGGTGFIGRWALDPLVARGFDVHAVSSRPPRTTQPSVQWHEGNLLASGEPSRLIAAVRPTHLLHFAWSAPPGLFWTTPENVDWVAATLALARAFAENGGQRFVGAGSGAEYARSDEDCDERTTPLEPATLYGTCKLAAHRVVGAFARGRFSSAWGRIFHLYGPHEDRSRLVPAVIRALLEQRDAECTAGTQVRDFMHVQDVAAAFVALLDSDVEGAVNIASGRPARLADVIANIGAALNAPDRIRLGARPIPAGEFPRVTATVTRLRDEVGWSSARDLDRGLAETIAWWRTQAPASPSPSGQ